MKSLKYLAIAAILSLAAVGSAFAAAGSTTSFSDTTSTVGTPAITVKVSKNVTVVYTASTAVSGNGSVGYGITSAHSSGSKISALLQAIPKYS